MKQIPLRVDEDMLDRIELARGLVSREAWIRDAIASALGGAREDVPPDGGTQAYTGRHARSDDIPRRPIPKGK